MISGCTTTDMHTQTVPDKKYREALTKTNPDQYQLPAPGSAEEEAMLQGVKTLFEQYNHEQLSANVEQVYAKELYFRDAFRQLDTAHDIRDYLLEGLEPLESAEFVFNNIARVGGDFYLDWTMRLDFKKTPSGTWEESMGMTRMRFNSEGKIVFHQDFWDPTDIVYTRIPIAKQLIAYVQKKM